MTPRIGDRIADPGVARLHEFVPSLALASLCVPCAPTNPHRDRRRDSQCRAQSDCAPAVLVAGVRSRPATGRRRRIDHRRRARWIGTSYACSPTATCQSWSPANPSARSRRSRSAGLVAIEVEPTDVAISERISLALIEAVANDLLQAGARVVVVYSGFEAEELDSLTVIRLGEHLEQLTARDLRALETSVPFDTLKAVVDVAVEIGREGREGKAVGTLIVVGDARNVILRTRQLGFDPFKGYKRKERNVRDFRVREAIKEIAQLDGAFVVARDGTVEAACRLIDAPMSGLTLPKGLGTRHWAAAAITEVTKFCRRRRQPVKRGCALVPEWRRHSPRRSHAPRPRHEMAGRRDRAVMSQSEPRSPQAIVIVADGVGGIGFCGIALRRVLRAEKHPYSVELFPWGHGLGRWHADLTDALNRDEQARLLAESVRQYRIQQPQNPIFLVAKSGGCGRGGQGARASR